MAMMSEKPDLIIFDCDGVLVDSESVTNQLMVDNLRQHGLTLSLAEAMDLFVGGSMAGVMQKALELGANLPDNWLDEIYTQMHAMLEQGVEPVDGIPSLLDTLDTAGLPYCVASNGSEEKMHITLGQNGLHTRFANAMFSAHTHKTWKPNPELFLLAASRFNTPADRCLVIEDSRNGVLAASRAGMRCLAYCPEGDNPALQEFGARCFTQMQQVPELLGLRY